MKQRVFFRHLLFWAAVYLLWVLFFHSYRVALTKTVTIQFCYLIFITTDYYIINNFIIPVFLSSKKYIFFVCATLFCILVSAWFRSLMAIQMNRYFFHDSTIADFSTVYLNSIGNITLWVLMITVSKMLIDKTQTEKQLVILEKERVKTELDYLKAQINPHTLFNSLNTIYGYIDKSNKIARNTLLQFSELLHYQLYDCSEEKVSLEKEITYLRNYIAFQQLRKEENLIVYTSMDDIEKSLQIAPLLLTVIIENAFKFVNSTMEKENKICINIYTKDGILYSTIINTKERQRTVTNNISSGIGITNLKRRLKLLYPGKYEFIINDKGNTYETQLNIHLV